MVMSAPVSYPRLATSGRRAALDVSCEILADTVWFLSDNGIAIVGSLLADDGVVRLIVDSELLPEECAQAWHLVRPTFIQETVGSQRLVRLESIRVVERLSVVPKAA